MAYATARETPIHTIPVIDIGGLDSGNSVAVLEIAREMQAAAQAVGFFYIANHGVSGDLIGDTLAVSREFFERSVEDKTSVKVTEKKRGYIAPRLARMKEARSLDFRETFLWGREFDDSTLAQLAAVPLIGANQWPAFQPDLRATLIEYFESCVVLGRRVLTALALAEGLPPAHFSSEFKHTMSRGSTLYYPPQPTSMGEDQFGIGAHTDWGVLTLLYQDDVGGLEVRGRDGTWIAAHPIPHTFVVNIGDCLERWTNKRLLSNTHRAVNRSDRVRQSIAMFIDPDFDTPVVPVVKPGEAPQFEPTTCGAQVLDSFRRAYGG